MGSARFDPGLFEGLPPHTAELLRENLSSLRLRIGLQIFLAAAVAFVLAVVWPYASPVAVVFAVLALLNLRRRRRIQRVIRLLVEEPERATNATIQRVGEQQVLDIRLADNSVVRVKCFHDDARLTEAQAEIRAAIGR